ncbi:MAG: HNH endonuclease [Planctomycetaceae bacterium]|nr:HNH endonuclease [Planctomycetaceae bacterium]
MFRNRFAPTRVTDNRPPSSQRGYDADWRRLRSEHLTENPLCAICLSRGATTPATCVDHRVPITVDPSRRLDRSNLRSCCDPHHQEITARFKREGINEPEPVKLAVGGWM